MSSLSLLSSHWTYSVLPISLDLFFVPQTLHHFCCQSLNIIIIFKRSLQNDSRYSKWGLTNALYSRIRTSFLILVDPSQNFVPFTAAWPHCLFILQTSAMSTLKFFFLVVLSYTVPPILYPARGFFFPYVHDLTFKSLYSRGLSRWFSWHKRR